MKKYDYKNLTSSSQLIEIAKRDLHIDIQVFSRDDGPRVYKQGFYIFNLDSARGPGSHWVGLIKVDEDNCLYFDSYGFPPPQEQMQAMFRDGDKLFWNKRQIQPLKSILCGFYCLAFFKFFKHNPPTSKATITKPLNDFVAMFSNDKRKNDAILKRFL